jgi:hypothetical protein
MFSRRSPEEIIQQQLVKVKFLINTLNKNSIKSKTKEKQFAKKAKKALAIGDENTAQVYVRQSVQHKHIALKLLKLACRMEIMEANIRTHVQTNQLSNDIVKVVGDLTRLCSPNMTLDNINMFEQLFDDVTIATNYTADTLDQTMAEGTSTTEEKELMDWARDSNALEGTTSMPTMSKLPNIEQLLSKPITKPTSNDLF